MKRVAFIFTLLLVGTGVAFCVERPLPHRSPPFAKGYAEKVESFPKRLTIRTREGVQTFTWDDRTYFFRGKQKIVPEQINPGDLLAIRFTTTDDGAQLIQRLKVVPPAEP